jgi:hypothetical protein
MKASSKLKKTYRTQGDRNQQEQIRKRRHNLFKRLKEFNDRYEIEIWLTMRMPSGRIYIFATDPNEPVPSDEQIVSLIAGKSLFKVTDYHPAGTECPGHSQDAVGL